MEDLQYDKLGRMKYNPSFHFNHGKPWTLAELEYLCKYIESDGAESIGLAIGKTGPTVNAKLTELRKRGLYNHYKNSNIFYL